jgi:hypothetical protein
LPAKLSALVDRLNASGVEAQIRWAKMIVLAFENFPRAVHELGSVFPKDEVQSRIVHLVSMIHEESLEGLEVNLALLSNSHERASAAAMVGAEWSKRDPSTFAKYASSHLKGASKNSALAEVVKAFSQSKQFYQADQVLQSMPYSGGRSTALGSLASRWGTEDSAAALDWAQRLELPEDRHEAVRNILGSAKLSVEALAQLANETDDLEIRNIAVKTLGKELVETDLGAAMQWLTKVPEQYRAGLQRQIAKKLAQSDLSVGTKYATAIADASLRTQAIDEINGELVMKDPQMAARWLAELPLEFQERAAYITASRWYDIDSIQASEWIDTLPNGKIKDRALLALSSRLKASDKSAAEDVAKQIGDPKLRAAALQ